MIHIRISLSQAAALAFSIKANNKSVSVCRKKGRWIVKELN